LYAFQEERRSRSELLGLLSFAAEKINDFSNAADFERARLNLLANEDERRKAETRIDQLTAKSRELAERKPVIFTVDERPVTTR